MKFRYENRTGSMKMNLISISLAIDLEQSIGQITILGINFEKIHKVRKIILNSLCANDMEIKRY